MSLCTSIPSVLCVSKLTRSSYSLNGCVRQRCDFAGKEALPSLQYMCHGFVRKHTNKSWLKRCTEIASRTLGSRIRASQEGVPKEVLEDSKFVPIKEDDPRFGPPAMLLLGFNEEEVAMVQEMLTDMGGDFMKVLLCTDEMMKGTLIEALNSTQTDLSQVKPAEGCPHICFFSGLNGEELMMLVRAFPEAGLRGVAFAAHVPKNSTKQMGELIEEIMGDHDRLSKPHQPSPS